ncbi:nuclear transport factor 2 family protein [Sorangium sp. So ce291]|uniref:nuclear transport factor 2 family protein n=1 Tax=Sorangium sp. So ce291 TaxID=3133294 RepID=UPI003F64611B
MNADAPPARSHANSEKLRAIYGDLTRIGEFAAEDMVLYTASRDLRGDRAAGRVVGKEAAVAHERELIRLTDGTLVMAVDHIVANDHFGAVLGVLRARLRGATLAMPFCGLWRFREGLITHHWENAHDASATEAFLLGLTSGGLTSGAPA